MPIYQLSEEKEGPIQEGFREPPPQPAPPQPNPENVRKGYREPPPQPPPPTPPKPSKD